MTSGYSYPGIAVRCAKRIAGDAAAFLQSEALKEHAWTARLEAPPMFDPPSTERENDREFENYA